MFPFAILHAFLWWDPLVPPTNKQSFSVQKIGIPNMDEVHKISELIVKCHKVNKDGPVILVISMEFLDIAYQSYDVLKQNNIFPKVILFTTQYNRDYVLEQDGYLKQKYLIYKVATTCSQVYTLVNELFQLIRNTDDRNKLIDDIEKIKVKENIIKKDKEQLKVLSCYQETRKKCDENSQKKKKGNRNIKRQGCLLGNVQRKMFFQNYLEEFYYPKGFLRPVIQKNSLEQKVDKVKPEEQMNGKVIGVIWVDKNMHNNGGSVSEIKKLKHSLTLTTFTDKYDMEEFLTGKMFEEKQKVFIMISSNSMAPFIFKSNQYPYANVVECIIYCGSENYARENCRKHGQTDVQITSSPGLLITIVSEKLEKYLKKGCKIKF